MKDMTKIEATFQSGINHCALVRLGNNTDGANTSEVTSFLIRYVCVVSTSASVLTIHDTFVSQLILSIPLDSILSSMKTLSFYWKILTRLFSLGLSVD